jgi:flagellar biosynthesis protein
MSAKPKHPPRKRAVALRYDRGKDAAPLVVAKGTGAIAEKIIALAEEYDIPMYQDPDLVEILAKINLGQSIPPELFQAVAEVLAFVYRMNEDYRDIP